MKKQRSLRKRQVSEEQDDDDADPEHLESIRDNIQDTKLLQKHRSRGGGVDATALLSGAEKPAGMISRPKALPSGPRRDGKDNLMETYIKEQVKDEVAEDPDLEKYIQEHIERRLGKRKALDVEPEPAVARTEEDDLYIIPENLKAHTAKVEEVSTWLTGVAEVPLSLDQKLRNIEETEAAKKRLLAENETAAAHWDEDEDEEQQSDEPGLHRAMISAKDAVRYSENMGKMRKKQERWRERRQEKGMSF